MAAMDRNFFPETARYMYSRAPLVQVAAQLRFPPLLRIQKDTPADFQERIRSTFPFVERTAEMVIGQQLPPEVMQLLAASATQSNYQFLTEDRKTTLTLAPDSLTLVCNEYARWEHFKTVFSSPLAALLEIYKPSFFSRVGLRYTNAIIRSKLNLTDIPWSQLFRSEILGELVVPEFEKNLVSSRRILRLNAPDGNGSLLLQHGTSKISGATEQAYSMDFDFFTETKTEPDGADKILDLFHARAFRAFKWCITDALHKALGPTELAARVSEIV